jgi:hypothetical protein
VPESKSSASSESKPVTPSKTKLAPASESGDPAVHALLAQLETAKSNGDDEQAKAVTKKLADLGFE